MQTPLNMVAFTWQAELISRMNSSLVWLCCYSKIPQTQWLKQQKIILSQFWRPEVQGKGAGRLSVWHGPFPWVVLGDLQAVSLHSVSLVCSGGVRYTESTCQCLFSQEYESYQIRDPSNDFLFITLEAPFLNTVNLPYLVLISTVLVTCVQPQSENMTEKIPGINNPQVLNCTLF